MNNTCAIVLINSDFTEGRGPMRFHAVFKDKDSAEEYVKNKEGIFGSRQYKEAYFVNPESLCYNGYTILLNVPIRGNK